MNRTLFRSLMMIAVILIGSVAPTLAGASGGPKEGVYTISGNSYQTFTVTFRGGEEAQVALKGDGNADLDLYIYDEYGNLVASDDDDTATCYVSWTPRWTARFTIKVVNQSR